MEQYPSIEKQIQKGKFYLFDKIDGSNIRVEWVRGKGFSKFGTRTRLLDEKEYPLGEAVAIFNKKYKKDLENILNKSKYQKATLFFEFYGENSFAGNHQDEEHDLLLIDIYVYKKGMLPPSDFIKLFKNVKHAPMLYYGNVNQEIINSVEKGVLDGMTFEGVVCKGEQDKYGRTIMFKIKNIQWVQKLKEYCGEDINKFEELL